MSFSLIIILIGFSTFNVSIPGRIRYIDIVDLNGDGFKEIVTLGENKRIEIFQWQKEGFHECIDTTLSGGIIDFGDVIPEEKGEEIVVTSHNKVQIIKYSGKTLMLKKELFMSPSIVYPEHSHILRRGKVVLDFDGKDVILFFYPHSCVLLNSSGIIDSFNIRTREEISTIFDKTSPVEELQNYTIKSSYIIPIVFFADVIGDEKEEFLQFINDTLFSNNKVVLNLSFLHTLEGKIRIFPQKIILRDINNDGKEDLIFCKGEAGSGLGKTSNVYVFLNKGNGFGRLPDQVIISESFSPEVILNDVNKDGKLDLILTTSGFNIFSLIKLILTKKMDIQYSVYMFKKHSFTKTPVYSRTFGIRLNSNSNLSGGIADFSVDFDNDGYGDILYFKENSIEVFKGNGKSFSRKPSMVFDIKTSSNYKVEDIDNNKSPDILFWNVNQNETKLWGLLR